MSKNKVKVFFRRLLQRVPLQEKVNFARHLSVTIKSGMPLLDGLRLIRRQTSSKHLGLIIEEIIKDVNNGQFLAQSLGEHQHIFGDFFINMVRVGETSGNLSSVLNYISGELKKQREINSKVRSALIYPAVILVVTLGITIFLTLFIFPKILPIFVSLRVQLPFTTRFIIQLLTFLSNYGLFVLGGVVLLGLFARAALMLRAIHFYFDKLLLVAPFISKLIINLTLANFTRSLSVLLKSGMTIIDALLVAKGTFHNMIYRRHVERLIDGVKRGEELSHYLGVYPKLFPPMFVGMIQVGESTGNLEENLLYLSDYYESEVDDVVKNLTTILEPLLLLIMGFVVGFVALSIITPIYKITQELKIN